MAGDRRAALAATWALPRPVLAAAGLLTVGLLAPVVAAYVAAGTTAALGLAMGYTGCLLPATRLPARYALLLTVPLAMTATVAAALPGQPFVAACFVALACLLVAPATMLDAGVVAGLPTVAAVYLTLPVEQDPAQVAMWVLAGGALGVLVLARVGRPAALRGLPARTAYVHAGTMAVAVGLTVLVVLHWEVPHGYWIAMTLTMVLRPFGAETRRLARQRVAGTLAGALVALALAALLPPWAALAAAGLLLVLMVGYAVLDRYGPTVACSTPFIVLLGAGGGGVAALGLAVERVGATVVGAVVAAGIALALARGEEGADDAAATPGLSGP